jgi:hypothetical protein
MKERSPSAEQSEYSRRGTRLVVAGLFVAVLANSALDMISPIAQTVVMTGDVVAAVAILRSVSREENRKDKMK